MRFPPDSTSSERLSGAQLALASAGLAEQAPPVLGAARVPPVPVEALDTVLDAVTVDTSLSAAPATAAAAERSNRASIAILAAMAVVVFVLSIMSDAFAAQSVSALAGPISAGLLLLLAIHAWSAGGTLTSGRAHLLYAALFGAAIALTAIPDSVHW